MSHYDEHFHSLTIGNFNVTQPFPQGLHYPHIKKQFSRTSLVAQWLRIRLPVQGTRVRALVREDTTCRGAHVPQLQTLRSRDCEPQLLSPRATTTEAHVPRACAPKQEKPPQCEARTPQRRVAPARRN